ncbi:YbfB/YjiJ family MFS transporter [Methylobacterium nigriterrae]|uniref:YbfB/YjiJ family MFS transporter n=1 Tax=Methylobacterium nigriterrae TaxID=3127512 RepID=UPI0030133A4D
MKDPAGPSHRSLFDSTSDANLWFLRPALSGASATFVGVGLARFAYLTLFPVMVTAQWLDGGGAGLLGAFNLMGYLIGVSGGRLLAKHIGVPRSLDCGMLLTALSFFACGWNGGLVWLAIWRSAAGVSGGVLMSLAGPAVQAVVEPAQRGTAGGVVISGVGTGIIVTALAIPPILNWGLPAAWIVLAACIVILWAFARPAWPRTEIFEQPKGANFGSATVLILAYGIAGAGMVPHMVYLADLAVRGQGHTFSFATYALLLFGLGALSGTLAAGRAVDRWGGARTIQMWFAFQTFAVALVLAPPSFCLLLGAFLGGFGGIGATAVVLGRAREIAGETAGVIWQYATASFAISQAVSSLALALVFAHTGSHGQLFAVGLACSLAAVGMVTWFR